jgi:hypothetical protein
MKIDKKKFLLAAGAMFATPMLLFTERTEAQSEPAQMSPKAMAEAHKRCLAICKQVIRPACNQACKAKGADCSSGSDGTCARRELACVDYHCGDYLLTNPALEV